MTDLAGSGLRCRVQIAEENYYIVVTHSQNGPHVCATCPRENAPENRHLREVLETVCSAITCLLRAQTHEEKT